MNNLSYLDKKKGLYLETVLFVPDVPDSYGDVFTREDIQKYKTSEGMNNILYNVEHEKPFINGVYSLESYITRSEEMIGGKVVPVGALRRDFLVTNPYLIRMIKSGRLNGVSPSAGVKTCNVCRSGLEAKSNIMHADLSSTECLDPISVSFVNDPSNGYSWNKYNYDDYKMIKYKKKDINSINDIRGFLNMSENKSNETNAPIPSSNDAMGLGTLEQIADKVNDIINYRENKKAAEKKALESAAKAAVEEVLPAKDFKSMKKTMKGLDDFLKTRNKTPASDGKDDEGVINNNNAPEPSPANNEGEGVSPNPEAVDEGVINNNAPTPQPNSNVGVEGQDNAPDMLPVNPQDHTLMNNGQMMQLSGSNSPNSNLSVLPPVQDNMMVNNKRAGANTTEDDKPKANDDGVIGVNHLGVPVWSREKIAEEFYVNRQPTDFFKI